MTNFLKKVSKPAPKAASPKKQKKQPKSEKNETTEDKGEMAFDFIDPKEVKAKKATVGAAAAKNSEEKKQTKGIQKQHKQQQKKSPKKTQKKQQKSEDETSDNEAQQVETKKPAAAAKQSEKKQNGKQEAQKKKNKKQKKKAEPKKMEEDTEEAEEEEDEAEEPVYTEASNVKNALGVVYDKRLLEEEDEDDDVLVAAAAKEALMGDEEEEEEEEESRLVVITNLPHGFHNRGTLMKYFTQIAPVERVEIDPTTSTGYVLFSDAQVARVVVREMDYYLLEESVLRLSICKVPPREQEEKVWNVVKNNRTQHLKELYITGTLQYNTLSFFKKRQRLQHYPGIIPETEYVVKQQRYRDVALQRHLAILSANHRPYMIAKRKENLAKEEADFEKLLKEKGINFKYQE